MSAFNTLAEVPISEIELFINQKVRAENISVSYQKGLVGTMKKLYELILDQRIILDYLYPQRKINSFTYFSKDEIKGYLTAWITSSTRQ